MSGTAAAPLFPRPNGRIQRYDLSWSRSRS